MVTLPSQGCPKSPRHAASAPSLSVGFHHFVVTRNADRLSNSFQRESFSHYFEGLLLSEFFQQAGGQLRAPLADFAVCGDNLGFRIKAVQHCVEVLFLVCLCETAEDADRLSLIPLPFAVSLFQSIRSEV